MKLSDAYKQVLNALETKCLCELRMVVSHRCEASSSAMHSLTGSVFPIWDSDLFQISILGVYVQELRDIQLDL